MFKVFVIITLLALTILPFLAGGCASAPSAAIGTTEQNIDKTMSRSDTLDLPRFTVEELDKRVMHNAQEFEALKEKFIIITGIVTEIKIMEPESRAWVWLRGEKSGQINVYAGEENSKAFKALSVGQTVTMVVQFAGLSFDRASAMYAVFVRYR